MAMQKRRSQCESGNTCRADSRSQTAQPPGTLRAADPLPSRASAESSSGDLRRPAAAQAATASAANPLALEASPAAVGNSFRESIRAGSRIPAASSSARARRGSSGRPSSVNESASDSPSATVVVVRSLSSATESEPASGRTRASSRLPQYLTSAMFACAAAVAFTRRPLPRNLPCAPRFPSRSPRRARVRWRRRRLPRR